MTMKSTTIVKQFNGTRTCKNAKIMVDDVGSIIIENVDGSSYTKQGLLDLVRLFVDACDQLQVTVEKDDPSQLKLFDFDTVSESLKNSEDIHIYRQDEETLR